MKLVKNTSSSPIRSPRDAFESILKKNKEVNVENAKKVLETAIDEFQNNRKDQAKFINRVNLAVLILKQIQDS